MPITLQNFQDEINAEADKHGVEVILGLWQRISTMSLDDVQDYIKLMEVYVHLKLYYHRVKKRTEDTSFDRDIDSERAKYWDSLRDQCVFSLDEINVRKRDLRFKLQDLGVNYKQFHPCVHHIRNEVIQKVLKNSPNFGLKSY